MTTIKSQPGYIDMRVYLILPMTGSTIVFVIQQLDSLAVLGKENVGGVYLILPMMGSTIIVFVIQDLDSLTVLIKDMVTSRSTIGVPVRSDRLWQKVLSKGDI